jgi:hypothetical protein
MVEGAIEVETSQGTDRHLATIEGWEVRTQSETVRLRGERRPAPAFEPLVLRDRPLVQQGVALPTIESPKLDGTLEGFDLSAPLDLDHEDQYRRSEEPYPGPEEFSARGFVNWNDEALYLGVEVMKPEIVARDPDAAPLRLDNDPDEIHGDGVQVYLRLPTDDSVYGLLIVPSSKGGELIVRPVSDTAAAEGMVRGRWDKTEAGYTLTLAVRPPGWDQLRPGDEIGFDLLINQMLPDRQRRAGQLVWSGGGGWVWLRGDRQDPSRFGTLELR